MASGRLLLVLLLPWPGDGFAARSPSPLGSVPEASAACATEFWSRDRSAAAIRSFVRRACMRNSSHPRGMRETESVEIKSIK